MIAFSAIFLYLSSLLKICVESYQQYYLILKILIFSLLIFKVSILSPLKESLLIDEMLPIIDTLNLDKTELKQKLEKEVIAPLFLAPFCLLD
jgi:hypothetical protein